MFIDFYWIEQKYTHKTVVFVFILCVLNGHCKRFKYLCVCWVWASAVNIGGVCVCRDGGGGKEKKPLANYTSHDKL